MQRYNFFANRQRLSGKKFQKHAFFIIVLTKIKTSGRHLALSQAFRTLTAALS
jgi:hypothetical protein